MTQAQILEVQAFAVRTNDRELLADAWAALGYDRTVAFLPATPAQRERGLARCAAALVLTPCPSPTP